MWILGNWIAQQQKIGILAGYWKTVDNVLWFMIWITDLTCFFDWLFLDVFVEFNCAFALNVQSWFLMFDKHIDIE